MNETVYTEEFAKQYTILANKNFEAPEEEHEQLETLGKQLLNAGYNLSKKPSNATYGLWDDMKYYLMELSQTEIKGDTLMVLGFLPVMLLLNDGEINRFNIELSEKQHVESIILSLFDNPEVNKPVIENIKIANFIITHDQLNVASPEHVYELLSLVQHNSQVSEYWTTDKLNVIDERVAIFYIPFVAYLNNDVPVDWHFSDIYEDEKLGMMSFEDIDTLWRYLGPDSDGDFEASLQYGRIEPYIDVIQDGETERDFANLEMGLTELKEYVDSNTTNINLNVILEIFWPVASGEILTKDSMPVIRLNTTYSVKDNESENKSAIYKIHVPTFSGQEWNFVVAKIFKLCYELGFPYVQVVQLQSKTLIHSWQNQHESTNVH